MGNSKEQVIINLERYNELLETEKRFGKSFIGIPVKTNEWDSKYYNFYNPENKEDLEIIKDEFTKVARRLNDLVYRNENLNQEFNSVSSANQILQNKIDTIKSKWWFKLL